MNELNWPTVFVIVSSFAVGVIIGALFLAQSFPDKKLTIENVNINTGKKTSTSYFEYKDKEWVKVKEVFPEEGV